jgi:hypothetical protein
VSSSWRPRWECLVLNRLGRLASANVS